MIWRRLSTSLENLDVSSSDGAAERWQRSSGDGAEMEQSSLKSLSDNDLDSLPLVKAWNDEFFYYINIFSRVSFKYNLRLLREHSP